MGEPLGPAGEVLLKHLSEVVGLFGERRVVREGLVSFLHLGVVDLRGDRAGQILWDYRSVLSRK